MNRGLLLFAVLVLLASRPVSALNQPNGAAVPSQMGCNGGQPTGLAAVLACQCTQPGVCNIGAPCPGASTSCDPGTNGTCETTLSHNVNDNSCIPSNINGLNPYQNASLTPDTFKPTCALTFTVVSRGTARFQNVFGWYNVTGQTPAANDLHVILGCNATPGTSAVLDVKSDPAYQGGDIGFFLISPEDHSHAGSCAGGDCCASVGRMQSGVGYAYYSQRQFNPDNTPASYIHLLVMNSQIVSRKFYFAWEDTFHTTSADFTDLVTSVQGVDCSGGGATCDTGQQGVCGQGVTACQNGAMACVGLYQPSPEKCDGYDNDCDGAVDNGATCPNPGDICRNGQCQPPCSNAGEFNRCPPSLNCDESSGVCVDPKCAGVSCPSDKVCRGGSCAGPCDDIVCPHGETCRMGQCVDPCKHTQCASGETCFEGLCVPGCAQCGGLSCSGGLMCDAASGGCFDPSCSNGCASGQYCAGGACHDACEGAKCPSGYECKGGDCVVIGTSTTGAGDTGDPTGTASHPAGGGSGSDGCGCAPGARSQSKSGQGNLLLALVLLGTALTYRRRR